MPGYFDINNRVALVTGASRGLGLAMAEALAEVDGSVVRVQASGLGPEVQGIAGAAARESVENLFVRID